MKTRTFIVLVLAMLVLAISSGDVYAAEGQSGKRVAASGKKTYQSACEGINPDPQVTVIQHDSWGMTYYDEQQVGSMGRVIAVGPGGHRHMVFQDTRGSYGEDSARYVAYNCKDPLNEWIGAAWVDGDTIRKSGYAQILTMHDGREVILYHCADQDYYPYWHTTLALADSGYICSGYFSNLYDLPDRHYDTPLEDRGWWPKGCVVYVDSVDTDYIHVVTTDNKLGYNKDLTIGYQRCAFQGENLVCRSPDGWIFIRIPNTPYPAPLDLIMVIDTVKAVSAVAVSSPVSHKVAVIYAKHREDGIWNNDVFYIESTNNGEDWLDGSQWPPVKHNVSDYASDDRERAYTDLAACYDYNDSLHIVWNAHYYDSAAGQVSFGADLYHWSKASGISLVATAYPQGTDLPPKEHGWSYAVPPPYYDTKPGFWHRSVCKPSISAQDPIHHPGGDPDSVYLFCTWTQFVPGDTSAQGWGNGDVYATVSHDGGMLWGLGYNLTNTQTPGCAAGECLSEHWSSLAENLYDGDLHLAYVCDRDGGAAVQGEGDWTDNDMMYLHAEQLPLETHCGISYTLVDPVSLTVPPIKVSPDKDVRLITFDIHGLYNLGGNFTVTSNHGSVQITGNASGYLSPGEAKTVEAVILCSAEGFINATVTITGCIGTEDETTIDIPLYAVCSNDYYECPRDEATFLLKNNGKLGLWVCSNSGQQVWHRWIQPEENQQVIFAGGTFVATIPADDPSDTVIGRQDYSDVYTGARDTINRYCGEWNRFEPGCLVQKIHVENTYIWKTRFPDALRWYWIDIYKQIFIFHDDPEGGSCPDWRKDIIVKYIWIKFSRPPLWWPDPGEYLGHGDIYLGHYADVDAPFDEGCVGCNTAGYDEVREMVWLHGFYNDTLPEGHPEYEDFYVGLAFTDPSGVVVEPLGMQCVRNDSFLYPQEGWGWKTDQFYDLITTPGENIHDPDSVVDRTVVLTSGMILADPDSTFEAEYILIETAVQGASGAGLQELQAEADLARSTMIPELDGYGLFNKYWIPPICGDINLDGEVCFAGGDIIALINYLFLGCYPLPWPMECRADVTGNGVIDSGDIVKLIGYCFLGESALQCPDHCGCPDG